MLQRCDRSETTKKTPATTGRVAVSLISAVVNHLALSLVPLFFPASPLIIQFLLSALVLALVLGLGRWCRRVLGLGTSAPAFVLFSIVLVWAVYFVAVRPGVPWFIDIAFNLEVVMLIVGLYSILLSDPGFVASKALVLDKYSGDEDGRMEAGFEGFALAKRVRYCKCCKAYVKGYDHHCPAFGNCIGEKNYALFMVILFGFLCTEASYILCSFKFYGAFQNMNGTISQLNLLGVLAISTMLFSLIQVLWQGMFFIWHLYCICFNIRTDEWINWRKYPEFQNNVSAEPGQCCTDRRFRNSYDKGVLQNVKEVLQQQTDTIGV